MKNNVKYIAIAGLLLGYSQIGFCDVMRDASKEGSNLGKSSVNQAKSTMTGFNPEKELQGFTRNPNETQYQKNDSGLSQAGNKELADSELGQSARDSFINNPKDKISWDSDLIQNALDIKDKADGIVSGTGENCVKQTQNESYFTNHVCEKEETIKSTCTRTAKITWVEVDGWENQNIVVRPSDFSYFWYNGPWSFSFKSPVTGTIQSATLTLDSGYLFNQHVIFMNTTFQMLNASRYTLNAKNMLLKEGETVTSNRICFGNNGENCRVGIQELVYKAFASTKTATFTLNMIVTVKVKTLSPKIEWVENCPINKEEAVKVREWCSQKGEKRIFKKDGKEFEVYSDCWEYSEEWVTNEGDDNTCIQYEKDPNCTVGERKCILKIGNSCIRNEIKYQCQHTTKTEGYVCGDKFYCDDGSCVDTIGSENNGFNEAVSQLAAISQAGKEMSGLDESKMKAFSGKAMECRKAAAGFSDCCKSSGWGNDIGLAQCNSEEKAIGQAKAKKVIISVGTYCSNKVLGVCLQKKSSYCVFDNKLARIVQAQGRSGQLGIGFGSAKNPDCRGISINELQRLRFDYMDFSDFYEDLQNNLKIPEQDKLLDEVNRRMKEKFDEGKK
ncbi:type-F conjugative transfer system mating-pair stabilization protein TraN [Proteus genomosp. 6]|uniref:Type-F conjugative transfer system mating-pair stabilization protein TraN n=1 Tax=Proteus genomosp. 6 TaxID=1311820 RepID=A0ABV1LDY2_9GAMM